MLVSFLQEVREMNEKTNKFVKVICFKEQA